jgi:hypothetical protein
LTIYDILLHFCGCSIALNLRFTTYTFSPIFPDLLSPLPQIEPIPRQVKNHYLQKNQEVYLQRALAFKPGANFHCPSNVCFPLWIVLPMTYVLDIILQVGWKYQSGNQWWQKWRPHKVQLVFQH